MIDRLRLKRDFFIRDALDIAPELLGMAIVVPSSCGTALHKHLISEVEVYRGIDDKACHASKGRTQRTETMYAQGGTLYVYLIYGMYWMLNIVTGVIDDPQALLIRGVRDCYGPGRLSKKLGVDRSFNGEDLCTSSRIWLELTGRECTIEQAPRIGIGYAGEYWSSIPWRFLTTDLGAKR